MTTNNSWLRPALPNTVEDDITSMQAQFDASAKQQPSLVANRPIGSKEWVEVSTGKWQLQMWDGEAWSSIGTFSMDCISVGGFFPSTVAQANVVAVRDADGALAGDITGNAATSTTATNLSATLSIVKGGTGATSAASARINLDVPPTNHATTGQGYGVGNASKYGHLRLSDAVNATFTVANGFASSPVAVKTAYDKGAEALALAETKATPAYVLEKIAELVGGAPDMLNTFNEIADALGDDPNFAATLQGLIGNAQSTANSAYTLASNALPKTGGTVTGALTVNGSFTAGVSVSTDVLILDGYSINVEA